MKYKISYIWKYRFELSNIFIMGYYLDPYQKPCWNYNGNYNNADCFSLHYARNIKKQIVKYYPQLTNIILYPNI